MQTVEGFLLIPVDMRLQGPYNNLKYSARPMPSHLLKQGGGVLTNVLKGVVRRGESFVKDTIQEGPVEAVGGRVKKGAKATVETVEGGGRLVEKSVRKTGEIAGKGVGLGEKSEQEDPGPERKFLRGIFRGKKEESGDPKAGELTRGEDEQE